MGTSKQDRHAPRNVQDMERKYNFGESFAEVYNIATGARDTAEEAKKTADEAKTKADNPEIDHEAVFNALTEDGKCQGLYRSSDGNIYINAEFIKSGIYIGEAKIFLEPSMTEYRRIKNHCYESEVGWEDEEDYYIPQAEQHLYDFDGNGEVTMADARMCLDSIENGVPLPEEFRNSHLSVARIEIDVHNAETPIRFTATNIWGKSFDFAIGIQSGVFVDNGDGHLYRMVDGEKVWLNPPFLPNEEYKTFDGDGNGLFYKKFDAQKNLIYHGTKDMDGVIWWKYHDYIEESGTSGIWTYEKYASGKAVCYGTIPIWFMGDGTKDLFVVDVSNDGNFPFVFDKININVTSTNQSSLHHWYGNIVCDYTRIITIAVHTYGAPYNGQEISSTADVCVIGTWK